jgi:hypothetical protein
LFTRYPAAVKATLPLDLPKQIPKHPSHSQVSTVFVIRVINEH